MFATATRPALRALVSAVAMCASPHPPGARGSHVLLDFVGFTSSEPRECGEWTMRVLREAVASHGVREVHHKLVVLGEEGESPPGFTAVALLDESHVTAHCYSESGLLAVDVFTCGTHDPRPLASDIRKEVEARMPGAQCILEEVIGRFRSEAAAPPVITRSGVRLTTTRVRRSSNAQRMVMLEGGEEDGAAGDDGDGDDDMLSSFASRVEASGGSTSLREYQLKALKEEAGDAVGAASNVLNKALDLDGGSARRSRSLPPAQRQADVGWQSFVAFCALTCLLAGYAALTTDFGDGGGGDAGVCTGDARFCTRSEIERSAAPR